MAARGTRQVSSGFLQKKDQRKRMMARWIALVRDHFAGQTVTAKDLTRADIRPDIFADPQSADKWLGEMVKQAKVKGVLANASRTEKNAWIVSKKDTDLATTTSPTVPTSVPAVPTPRALDVDFGDLEPAWQAFMQDIIPGKAIKATAICERSPFFQSLGSVETGHVLSRLCQIAPRAPLRKSGAYCYTTLGMELRSRFIATQRTWDGHNTELAKMLAEHGLDTQQEYGRVFDEIYTWFNVNEIDVVIHLLVDHLSLESFAAKKGIAMTQAKNNRKWGMQRLRNYMRRRRKEISPFSCQTARAG